MPEQADRASERVEFRPRRTRVVAWVAAVLTVLASAGLAVALSGPVTSAAGSGREPVAVFSTADRIGLIGLGVIGAAALLLLARPLVVADAEGVRVRNVLGDRWLPWGVVRAVRFDRGSSWATLELQDDDVLGVLAVQVVDKEYAVVAAAALRARHAAFRQRSAPGQT